MQVIENFDERLKQSARIVHAWGWMAELSKCPEEALEVLREEARFLVRMGPLHSSKWREVGSLIVAYNELIGTVRQRCLKTSEAA